MNKIWKAVAAGTALLLAACTANTHPSTPEEAAKAFIEAVGTHDAATIIQLTAGYADMSAEEQKIAVEVAREAAKDVAPVKKDILKNIMKEVTVGQVKTEGNTATVTLKDATKSMDLTVKKEKDGTWRVVAPF